MKYYNRIFLLICVFTLVFVSLSLLLIGRILYRDDATLLWCSGALFMIAIDGLVEVFKGLK